MKTLLLAAISVLVWISTGSLDAQTIQIPRGRPTLNAARTTFVADNGQLLRGPYESTEWTTAAPLAEVTKIKNLGFNAVHLYAEVFNPTYPATTNNTPGYAVAEVDKMVTMTRDLGLYLVMTIGNGANNGNHNYQWAVDFWNFYALRYKNETHVVFEIHNEPMAWGPSYLTGTTPAGALDMEVAAYNAIRTHAPNTPVLLMSYAVLGGTGGTNAALTDIREFNQRVFGNPNAVWTNEAVGFHGYAGWEGTATAVAGLIAAGYPCFMTEFGWHDWGTTGGTSLEVELTTDLERLGVSWLTFQFIPPSGVSADVTIPGLFKDPVDAAGLSWTPDFGTWPVARAPFGNGGQPRATVANWVNNFLTGTVRIQAEDFDSGGEGVACHDNDTANTGGQYRAGEVVDIATCNDTGGGHKVGWTTDGEWLEYTILVKEPGYYNLALRYAAPNSGCAIEVISNVENTTGPRTLASTGANTNWATANVQVYLEYGRQKLRLKIPKGGFDLNWFELSPASTGIVANGNYKFLNAASILSMEGVAATNTVTSSAYTGLTFQQWNLQHMGGGQYKITSVGNGSSWNAAGGSLGLVSTWNNSNDRCFVILPAGGGYLRFLCVGSGLSLAPAAAAMEQQEYTAAANQKWGILAPTTTQFPGGLTATPTSPTHVGLTWNAVAGATSYNVKRSTISGGPYVTIATGVVATNFTDTVAATTGYYYVVSAVVGGLESLNSAEAGLLLPYPWLSQDIGAVGIVGRAEFRDGVFVQDGSGADIWGTADAFRFTYLTTSGDCTITARVASLENTDPWAKAGAMIRESLDPNSRNTFMFVSPGNGVGWQTRTSAGGNTTNAVTAGVTAPCWVRLVRSGNTFTGYYSTNGTTWTQRGTTTLAMSTNVFIGLALTSHNNSTLCTAGFDNVSAPNWAYGSPPVAPGGLTATGGSAAVALAWSAPPTAISYTVKRSSISNSGYSILSSGVVGTSFDDTEAMAGATYYYTVSATGYGGDGPDSNVVSATTFPSELRLLFDEGAGSAAADNSGHGWHGALVNSPAWAAGKSGSSVQLDGTNDHVTLPNGVASGLGNFTFATWVKLDALGSWSRVFDFGTGTDNYMFLTPRVGTTGNVRFAIRTPAQAEQIINGTAPLPTGEWTHVAVTRSGTLGTLYVNGAAVGSSTINLTPADLGRTTLNYLGRSQWAGDSYLDGQLDDFRIYASALSATDLAALASGPPVITSPTVASSGVGSSFVFQIAASNSPTGYSATGLPANLVLNETTGHITGTPAASGNFTVGLSAGNFAGNGAATLGLTITSPPITEAELRAPQIELSGGNASLTAAISVIGHSYQLQYQDDLAAGQWLNHGPAQVGTGGPLTYTMPVDPLIDRRFYRLLILQL
ncbi:MAG: LamG-like jellyroll fold domain-containing protein [Verrucomicrobiota bacterium]